MVELAAVVAYTAEVAFEDTCWVLVASAQTLDLWVAYLVWYEAEVVQEDSTLNQTAAVYSADVEVLFERRLEQLEQRWPVDSSVPSFLLLTSCFL
jgi:hypothetical protein